MAQFQNVWGPRRMLFPSTLLSLETSRSSFRSPQLDWVQSLEKLTTEAEANAIFGLLVSPAARLRQWGE